MRKLLVGQNLVEVESLKAYLEGVGIRCTIKNQYASGLAGEVPFGEVFPELWIIRNKDLERAKELLKKEPIVGDAGQQAWVCSSCGELHVNTFSACWKCGRERSEQVTPSVTAENEESHPESPDQTFHVPQYLKGFILGVGVVLVGWSAWTYFTRITSTTDRNGDGRIDAVYIYENKVLRRAEYDDNWDEYFETKYFYNSRGLTVRGEIDLDKDGKPDIVEQYTYDKLVSREFIDRHTGKVKKRAYWKLGKTTHEELDLDGDGKFEQTVYFDELEQPVEHPSSPEPGGSRSQ